MSLSAYFSILLVVFLVILLGLSMIGRKWVSDSSDLLVAGREISLPMAIIGVMAIGFAGTTVTLCPSFTLLYGLAGSAAWDIIYCICGLIVYGVTIGPIARRSGAQTLPEYLEIRYNKTVRGIVAVTMLIGMCGLLANNLTSAVNTIYGFTGWNRTLVLAIMFIVVLVFVSMAGLWSTTFTDTFQVIIGCIVVPSIFVVLISKFGGFAAINAAWAGGNSFNVGLTGEALPMLTTTYPSFLNFIVCFGVGLVYGSNLYWLRSASSRNEKVVRKSFIIGGLLTLLIFYLPFSIIGQYAGAFIGDQFVNLGGQYNTTEAYGVVARTMLPPLLGSIAVVGAVAASVSTSSSNVMGASSIASRDVWQRIRPNRTPAQRVRDGRVIMAIVVAFTWLLCQFPGGNTYLFAFANCWLVPPAILIVLGAIWPRVNNTGAKWGALCGMVVMVFFTLIGTVLGIFRIDQYVYTATLGFAVTLIVTVVVSLATKPSYFGAAEWTTVPDDSNREDIEITDEDRQILKYIFSGHVTMAELTDLRTADSGSTVAIMEKLDRGGYVIRKKTWGLGFYTFDLSEKGKNAITVTEKEAVLSKDHLTPVYCDILKTISENPAGAAEAFKKHQLSGMQIAAISYRLAEEGYIKEAGIFRRKLVITEKGRRYVADCPKSAAIKADADPAEV